MTDVWVLSRPDKPDVEYADPDHAEAQRRAAELAGVRAVVWCRAIEGDAA